MKNSILKALKEKYVGQVFEKGYGAWTEIGTYVCERLEQEYKVHFTYRGIGHKNEEMLICYKDWGVYKITFRKKKGEQHHNLYRGYYFTWIIKDIEIDNAIGYGGLNQESSVEDYIRVINNIIEKQEEEQNEKDKQLKEAFNLLKEHFGFEENNKVRNLIKDIYYGYYRLFDKED